MITTNVTGGELMSRGRKILALVLFTIITVISYSITVSFYPLEKAAPQPLTVSEKNREYFTFTGFFNTGKSEISVKSMMQGGDIAFQADDIMKVKSQDEVFLTTKSSKKFPFQQFDITINEDIRNTRQLEIEWQGHSNRMMELYGWDNSGQQWIKLETDIGRSNSNLDLTVKINTAAMADNGKLHILAGPALTSNILPGKIPSSDDYDFSFSWISDTQYYANRFYDLFGLITKYIADERKKNKNIYLIHTGDIIDNSDDMDQWERADKAMKLIEKANIPWGLAVGNHDVGFDKTSYNNLSKYFGEKRFKDNQFYGESRENNRDHYDLINTNDADYIVLYLGWPVNNETINWANQKLKQFSSKKAILALHHYLNPRGTYLDAGQTVYDDIVKPNSNVFMVLCGHYPGSLCNIKRIGGRVVYELLSDYQALPEGGSAFFKYLYFDTKNNLMYVNSFSPYLDRNNYYEPIKEQFILPLNNETGDVELATDWITVRPAS